MLRVRAWAQTDVGRHRSHNEDNYLIDLKLGLFGVADGMGGHEGGEVASETSLKVLRRAVQERYEEMVRLTKENPEKHRQRILGLIDECIQASTKAVFDISKKKAKSRGMGTTLSVLMILGNKGIIAHVGDSRIFLLRQNQIFQLTEDHSLVKEQLKLGLITEEEAERSPYKNVITRAVGAAENVKVDTLFVDLFEGDRFLLCSDGLHGYFQEGEIGPYMAEPQPEKIPASLINLSNERGGKDNITAVVLQVEDVTPKSQQERNKMRRTEVTLRMDVLQTIPVFQHLSYQELVKVMNITFLKTYKQGEVIFEEDQMGSMLYILLKGNVGIYRKGKHISTLVDGEHFGEMSLVDKNAKRSATALIETPNTQLLTITRKNFINLMREEQAIAVKVLWGFLKAMSKRLRQTTEKLLPIELE